MVTSIALLSGNSGRFITSGSMPEAHVIVHRGGQGISLNVGIQPFQVRITAQLIKALDAEEKRCSLPPELLQAHKVRHARRT